MEFSSPILIAGSTGLVGSAIYRRLRKDGYTNLLTPTHTELDLTDPAAISDYFSRHRPRYVFMAAAKVGGILANNTYPADFIYQNLAIQNALIHQSFVHNIEKAIFLGSSCIYPKHCPQPMKEEHLLTGQLEPTNEPYAIAKIAGIEMCWAYNRQHNTKFIPVMPTNLYGPNDNFDLETSYGLALETPQTETTPFYPRSPYAAAKLYAYWITVNYREAYGMYACNGILFNHESPIRGETFVTRKITRGLARIRLGLQNTLYLGNLEAKRDWGHARDYVEMQWLMLQQKKPEDFVIATGEQHSVRECVELAAKEFNMEISWKGTGSDEKGYNTKTGKQIIAIDPRYYRPTEVDSLLGDATKAREKLGWSPKVSFQELIAEMVKQDLVDAQRDHLCKTHGFDTFDYNE